jgi:uncharacterized protein (DUF433 family)
LIGVPYARLRRWCGNSSESEGIIHRQFPDDDILTLAELIELHFVKMFRSEGVSLQTIRRAARTAERQFNAKHPFAVKRFDTDGRTVFATLKSAESNKKIVEDLEHGQLVFERFIKPFFRKIEYRTRESLRYWPLEQSGRIVLDPDRRFGQPIDAETGVPTDAMLKALRAGGGQDAKTVANWLNVPVEAVRAAIRFDKSLST